MSHNNWWEQYESDDDLSFDESECSEDDLNYWNNNIKDKCMCEWDPCIGYIYCSKCKKQEKLKKEYYKKLPCDVSLLKSPTIIDKQLLDDLHCQYMESVREKRKIEILDQLSESPKFNLFQRLPFEIRLHIRNLVAIKYNIPTKKIDLRSVPDNWENLL